MTTEHLIFKTVINGSPETVWATIFDDASYRQWTVVFAPGSYAKTDWKKGSKAQFFDSSNNGMFAVIADSRPYEFLSIHHLGDIKNGVEYPNHNWTGYENYTLRALDGQTELTIGLDVPPEFISYMKDTWPKALEILKALAEK